MKKFIAAFSILALSLPTLAASGDFKEHFDLGQQYLSNYRYSGAITEFKSALRINYLDNSARIGLVNSYLARGMYSANSEKDFQKAADDYRSALFYLIYYPTANQVKNSSQAIVNVTSNLNKCLNEINFNTNARNRFEVAKQLRAEGNFSAAGYEFNQSLSDTSLIKESLKQTGDIMKLLGNNPKAAEYYKKAVSVDPNDIDLRLSYAKILDKLEQEDLAVEQYNQILTKTDNNKDVLYSLERIYKRKLEESPNNASVTANLGAIMQKLGNYDEALRYYAKAEYLDPSNTNTRINVGTLYYQKGDYKTAITAYDSILIINPDNLQANIHKAQALTKLGDNKASQDIYKKILAKDPNNEEIKNEMISSLKNSMTPTQFTEYIKKSSPQNASDILYDYALELHKNSKLSDAVNIYNEVIKLDDTNSEVYVNLAIAQGQNKNYNDALTTLKIANEKFPNNTQIADTIKSLNEQSTDAILEIAANHYNNKNYTEAINEYLKITPPTSETMLSIASAYQNLNNNEKAMEYYQEAFKLAPTNSDIAYYISAIYAEKEDFGNAFVYVQKSLALNKNNKQAQALNKMLIERGNAEILENAIALFDSEKFDESLTELNKLITKDNKNAYAYYYRAMIYDTKSNYKDAIIDYKKAISSNPDLLIINYQIGVDYDMLEDYKNAVSYYKSFLASYSDDDDYKKYAESRIGELSQYVK